MFAYTILDSAIDVEVFGAFVTNSVSIFYYSFDLQS